MEGGVAVEVQSLEVLIPWRIEQFSSCSKTLAFKSFKVPNKEECRWSIVVYPFRVLDLSGDHIEIVLEYKFDKEQSSQVYVKFDLKSIDGKCLLDGDYRPIDLTMDESKAVDGSTVPRNGKCKYISIERNQILPLEDDVLIINCFLRWDVNKDANKISNQNKLTEDFIDLMERSSFSDVVLVSNDGIEFPAHKCILASRSTVFATMFCCEMKGKQESRVEINDLNASTLRIVLRYIYASEFEKDKNEIVEVFVAADKYALHKLKQMCELELIDGLKIENVVECLLLGDIYNSEILKFRAFEFIHDNINEVYETESFKKLKVVKPYLLEQILGVIIKNSQK